MEYELNDIVEMKKQHPCGTNRWQITRMGADIKIKCLKCDNNIMMPRREFNKKIKKIVEKNNVNNVKFYDRVKKYEIPSLLKESDAVVMLLRDIPLYKYGMSPNKMYEYLASTKPIIFSGNVANDMVKEANAGVSVVAENSKKLKDGILTLQKMVINEREILGKNGRKYVEENYDTKILSKKIEKIILNLLEDKNV